MRIVIQAFFLLLGMCLILQCAAPSGEVRVRLDAPPFEKLSQYHFFKGDLAQLQPNTGVLPYDLNSPLFSDYAHKARFVWMPAGQSANYREGKTLDFPEGAVLIKNFFYEHDEREAEAGRRIIETRLLVNRAKGWEAHSYVWDQAQQEAHLDIVGDIVPVNWTNTKGEAINTAYIIPNKNQCKGCHSYNQKLEPIGPKVRNLNKTYPYAAGAANQLDKWVEVGYLQGYEKGKAVPKAATWDSPDDPLHERAMAYLDINCGHCHNPHGPGGTTGLNLVYGAPLDLNLGVNKPPVAAGRASGGLNYSIVKGQADQSILAHRMASAEPGVMMPELGRTMVHDEGVQLIQQWINAMEEE